MSVRIFDMHTLTLMFHSKKNGRRRHTVPALEPKILVLCQFLPPQPYALEVSNQVLKGLAIASSQPQRGGGEQEAEGDDTCR